jgi:hypothetical protein
LERCEKRFSRKRLIQTIVFGSIGVLATKKLYDLAESLKPVYVVNGNSNSLFADETPVWQRPTDWRKK